MKILLINNFLYNRGGVTTYLFALGELLENNGHKVYYWGMDHEKNDEYSYSNYFIKNKDYNELFKIVNYKNSYKVLSESILSNQSITKIKKFIEYIKPDIVHLNNIHAYITPSIIRVISNNNIPIIWTLHDFKLLCPEAHLVSKEKYCDKCIGDKFFNVLINKCKKGSYLPSMVAMAEAYTHKYFGIIDYVDFFIVPSKYLERKFIQGGLPKNKIKCIPHFLPFDLPDLKHDKLRGNYILYCSSLEEWKGFRTLLDAFKGIYGELVIAGEGSLKSELDNYIRSNNSLRIRYEGYVNRKKIIELISGSRMVIIPSIMPETFGYSAFESLALGIPVIASKRGALKEIVQNKVNGLLVEPENYKELKNAIIELLENDRLYNKLVKNIKDQDITNKYSKHKYLKNIENIYRRFYRKN